MKNCPYCGNIIIKKQNTYCSQRCSVLYKNKHNNPNKIAWNKGIKNSTGTTFSGHHHTEENKILFSKQKTGKKNPNHSNFMKENNPLYNPEIKLKLSKSLKSSEKFKQAMKERDFKGSNHPNWNGGTCHEPYPFEWNENLKESIRSRDNYCCVMCNKPQEQELKQKLSIHHIDYNKKNIDPSNLITLCNACHTKNKS